MGSERINSSIVEERVNLFPASALEYKKYKKFYKIGVLSVSSGALFLIGSQIYYNNIHHTGQQQLHSLQTAQLAVFCTGFSVMLVTSIPTWIHLKRSLSIYNKEICNR